MATILIVDDLTDNRKFLVSVLRNQGHRLLEAADGREGLAAVRAGRPDLVITDVLMPVMDGYQFVKQLRLDPAMSAVPVVFYTANYGEREARTLALSSGVSYVLTKPSEPDEVLRVVGRVLSGESETGAAPCTDPLTSEFDREHLRLLTDKLSEKTGDLRSANARLRALINIGLELASERDADRLLQGVCVAARDLFGASYVTLGIVDPNDRTLLRFVSRGSDAADWIKTGDRVSGILETVVAGRRTLRGENPGGDPARLQLPPRHPEVRAYLAAPIASPTRVYGWICFVGNEGQVFTEDDDGLVMALSGQVGRIYETVLFYAVAQDRARELEHEILERQQAESALRLERDRAQRYLDTADVILLALDLDGRISLVNRKGCDLLGWTEHELLGRDFLETCLPARKRVELRKRFHTVVGGDLSVLETPVLTRSGSERMVEWHNTLLRDDAGQVIGTFSSGTDITVRNQAIEGLRSAEERMRFALEAAGVGIWDMDFISGTLQWSEIREAQFGLQPRTFGGTFAAYLELVHPGDRDALVETMATAKRTGVDFSLQHRALWSDGSVRWLNGAGRILLGADGEPVRGVGISLDVTGRRALEEQFQQTQKMEAIGRLAGGVAHDFNNLLTSILGYCELLLADLHPDDTRYADISEIQKAGGRAAGLTRQLLAFSRKQLIELTVLDLNLVVGDMRTMLERLIGEDVSVVLSLGIDLTPVKADRGQIEQIVMNLAVNARDAMPHGGALTIETANVELDEHYARAHLAVEPGRYVVLTVTDSGVGMTPEVQARLFEPFFTTKGPGKGTGLGLAIVHGIVARSGGSVHVYSELGRGTSFKTYFPAADATQIAVDAPPVVARRHAGRQTVLVVEDAEGLRELTRRLLQRQGYTVLVAANADEALRLFERNGSIDVLLTDVVMPGASGPELTRWLVQRQPTLRVIYMSGYTEEAIVHHGVLDPGIAFLHKPFTSETLGNKIRELLDR
jgi:PAS domain S-box-containing protein